MFLLADALECFIQMGALVAFLLLTFGGYIVQQIAEVNKRRGAQQRMQVPPEGTNTASREIDEFLRQASRQSEPNPDSSTPATSRRVAPNAVDPYADRSQPAAPPPFAPPPTPVPASQPIRTLPSVTTHVSTAALARQAQTLGEEVSQADERMDEHLHERFDHGLGSLGDSSDAIHEDPNKSKLPREAVTAGDVISVLRNPARVREAIVLNEILTPPKW